MNEPETTTHFLLRCCLFDNLRITLMNDLSNIDNSILLLTENDLINLLLFGSRKYDMTTNKLILFIVTNYIKKN